MTTARPNVITNPADLTADQAEVLKAVHATHRDRGTYLPLNDNGAAIARDLANLGLVMCFGKRNFAITRDGIAVAIRMTSPAENIRAKADEIADLLPATLAVIEQTIAEVGGLGALTESVNRLRAILAGNY